MHEWHKLKCEICLQMQRHKFNKIVIYLWLFGLVVNLRILLELLLIWGNNLVD